MSVLRLKHVNEPCLSMSITKKSFTKVHFILCKFELFQVKNVVRYQIILERLKYLQVRQDLNESAFGWCILWSMMHKARDTKFSDVKSYFYLYSWLECNSHITIVIVPFVIITLHIEYYKLYRSSQAKLRYHCFEHSDWLHKDVQPIRMLKRSIA